jgi:hypothetical protein
MLICTGELWAPCATLRVAGAALMVKSGAAATVTEMVAVWLSEPDVPTKLTTTGELVLGAVGEAVSVITSGVPGCKDAVEGLAVTPAGRPLIAILMAPLKAFNAELFSVTCELEPAVRATVPGVAVSVKSGLLTTGAAVTLRASVAVWVSEPDVPTKLTVAGETVLATVVEAVKVIVCGVPGCRETVDGLAVTPAGSPLIATLMVPLKLFNAELLSVACMLAPAANVALVGDTVNVKSGLLTTGAPETLRVRIALCVSEPDVPTKLTVAGEAVLAAFAAAVNVTVCGVPGCRDIVAGLAVTPAGSPLMATLIVLLKLFSAELVSDTCVLAPAASVALVGDTANVKSLPSPPGGGTTAVAVTVTDTVAFALRSPEVPTRTT